MTFWPLTRSRAYWDAKREAEIERLGGAIARVKVVVAEHPCKHEPTDYIVWCACCRLRFILKDLP